VLFVVTEVVVIEPEELGFKVISQFRFTLLFLFLHLCGIDQIHISKDIVKDAIRSALTLLTVYLVSGSTRMCPPVLADWYSQLHHGDSFLFVLSVIFAFIYGGCVQLLVELMSLLFRHWINLDTFSVL